MVLKLASERALVQEMVFLLALGSAFQPAQLRRHLHRKP
jgi:hypothetical protein